VSLELLELAASALGELLGEVVFVGGPTVTLWITDPGAPPVRPTNDVDVVVEVATRTAFYGAPARAALRPYLLATKLEAFKGRGQGDFLASRDFGDIVALVDGRE